MLQIPAAQVMAARVAAVVLVGIALRWVYVFTLTDFRPHWRAVYLSAAAVFVLIGSGLWMKQRWAYLASLAMAALGLAFSCFMLVLVPTNLVLWLQALALTSYVVLVGRPLLPRRGK